MRLATWNVNSVTARLPRLLDWLERTAPDVLCLQETKTAQFPVAEVAALGYEVAAYGLNRWNGVAILSRVGLAEVTRGLPEEPGPPPADSAEASTSAGPASASTAERASAGPASASTAERASAGPASEPRAIGATCGEVRVWSVYVPNGRTPDSAHYAYKLRWLAALRAALAQELPRHRDLVVSGDFNVAPTDRDVWDPAAFVGATHVTPAEREAVAALSTLDLRDIVGRPLKGSNPFTYWDYRAGMFHQDMGMRIDLSLATPGLAERVSDAYIDREARKGKGPSDHAPLVVDFAAIEAK